MTRAASGGGGGGIASAARRGGGKEDDHSDSVPRVIAREGEGYSVKHPSSIWAGSHHAAVRGSCWAPPNRTVERALKKKQNS